MKTKKGATLVGSLVAVTILATTLVAVLNLQVSIIRAKFFLQYDNTANLLVAEGLEIVRAIYANEETLSNDKYEVDYNTTSLILTLPSTCSALSVNNTCDLDTPTATSGYTISSTSGNKIFYRFVEITNVGVDTIPKVTSTVIVKNPKGGDSRVYRATIELYDNIN
jgi:Tfp pilus assembly protein PilV